MCRDVGSGFGFLVTGVGVSVWFALGVGLMLVGGNPRIRMFDFHNINVSNRKDVQVELASNVEPDEHTEEYSDDGVKSETAEPYI